MIFHKERTNWQNFKYNFLPFLCTIGELIKFGCQDDELKANKQ